MGLKQSLWNEIIRRGFLSLDDVHNIARSMKKKESNAERRLRPSESPMIETVYNERDMVIGYRPKQEPEPVRIGVAQTAML